MIHFRANSNFADIVGAIDKFKKSIIPTCASVIRTQILDLRARGLNADGTPSVPYGKQYALYGRQLQGYPTAPVDHRKSGGYLDNIALWEYDPDTLTGRVGPDDSHEKIAEGLARYRTDFGVNPDTVKKIDTELLNEWEKYL